eukprot:1170362-Amphidinium_carterae.1
MKRRRALSGSHVTRHAACIMVFDAFASRSTGTLRLPGSLRDFGRSRSGVVVPFTEADAYDEQRIVVPKT